MTILTLDSDLGVRHSVVRWPDGSPPPVHGCRWCGFGPIQHAVIFPLARISGHSYTPPTLAQRHARYISATCASVKQLLRSDGETP